MRYKSKLKRKLVRLLAHPKRFKLPHGVSARYLQISKTRGIKIATIGYCSVKEAMLSWTYGDFLFQVKIMRDARKLYPFIPQSYGVFLIKIKNEFFPVILMQHLGDTRVHDVIEPWRKLYKPQFSMWYEKLSEQLNTLGIMHTDLHDKNVMIYKNNLWIIDFGTGSRISSEKKQRLAA